MQLAIGLLLVIFLGLLQGSHAVSTSGESLVNDWHLKYPEEHRHNCTTLCTRSHGQICGTVNFSCCTKGFCHKQYGMEYCRRKLKGFDCKDQRKAYNVFPELRPNFRD